MSVEKLEKDVTTEERLNELKIPFVASRISDVPNGSYVWFFGARWKKIKSGKKITKVIREDNISNNFCVAMEITNK